MISVSIQVFGKVQGVWYRASTKKEADKLNLKGTVRNLPDGSVVITATGESKAIENLKNWSEKGPEFARVDKVIVTNIDHHEFEDFKIIRS